VREPAIRLHLFPEFGGMTANVEFEALTGFSNAFLPYGSIPYQQYVRKADALAGDLLPLARLRHDRHPSVRRLVLEPQARLHAFGFDRFLSIENLPPMKSRGPLASDAALTEEIIKRADATERPFFTFAVSLQGHGPYEPNRYTTRRIRQGRFVRAYRTRCSIQTYAEAMADADRGLKRLMDWAQARAPTVIAFFGDHLPPLNQGYTETGFLKEPVPERREPPKALALHRADAAGRLVEQDRGDEGCRRDQPVADPAQAVRGCAHSASLLHRLPWPRGCQIQCRGTPPSALERRPADAGLVAGEEDRPADQRFPPAAIRRNVRRQEGDETVFPGAAAGGRGVVGDARDSEMPIRRLT
jgi:hypothetical protein